MIIKERFPTLIIGYSLPRRNFLKSSFYRDLLDFIPDTTTDNIVVWIPSQTVILKSFIDNLLPYKRKTYPIEELHSPYLTHSYQEEHFESLLPNW